MGAGLELARDLSCAPGTYLRVTTTACTLLAPPRSVSTISSVMCGEASANASDTTPRTRVVSRASMTMLRNDTASGTQSATMTASSAQVSQARPSRACGRKP